MQGGSAPPLAFWTMVAWLRRAVRMREAASLQGYAVHLHWDGFGRGEQHLSALRQPLAVPAHLQRGLWARETQGQGLADHRLSFPRLENKVSNPHPTESRGETPAKRKEVRVNSPVLANEKEFGDPLL